MIEKRQTRKWHVIYFLLTFTQFYWKWTQKWVWVRFLLFSRIIGNPSKTKKCRGISKYFGSVSAIFTFDSFPIFFGSVSSFFWVSFRFSEKVLNSQFVDRFPLYLGPFPLFLGPFPHFLGSFPVFKKSFKFSVCWSVSSFFGSVSSFFGSVSGFLKKF